MDAKVDRFRDLHKRIEVRASGMSPGLSRGRVKSTSHPETLVAQVFWEADNAWYRGTVTGYHKSTNKHSVLYDDDDMERVCLDDVPHRCV